MQGKGAPARNKDGKPGNLMLEFQVERHPVFVRSDFDILMTKTVDFVDALLGTVIRSSSRLMTQRNGRPSQLHKGNILGCIPFLCAPQMGIEPVLSIQ